MNNFKEKYVQLKSDIFYMVYYDINDFVLEHRDKQFDWSGLSFDTVDYAGDRKRYRFGPKVDFPIKELNERYNDGRKIVETLEFIVDKLEEIQPVWDGIVVNGKEIRLLGEEEKVCIADYMEKQLKL